MRFKRLYVKQAILILFFSICSNALTLNQKSHHPVGINYNFKIPHSNLKKIIMTRIRILSIVCRDLAPT